MDFNKTRYTLNNILRAEEIDGSELDLIMNKLEDCVFEDPFNVGATVSLARAKVAFGQEVAISEEQALEYFIDAAVLTDKALAYLPDDEISIKEAESQDFFFIRNRAQRLENNDIRFQAYSSALQANILCYFATEEFPSGQERHKQWALDAANGLNKILPTVTIAKDLQNISELSNEFFSYVFKETAEPKYALARMTARAQQSDSIKLARAIDPRFPKIIPELIH